MKLKELQLLIFSDLDIIHDGFTYKEVFKLGGVFYKLRDKEVIGIRSTGDKLIISIK